MNVKPRVALLIETSRGYGRGLLKGIVRYARLHGPWSFYISPGDFEQALPKMAHWGGTGIIARVETPQVAEAIRRTRLPVIALDLSEALLRPRSRWRNAPEISPDPAAAARMAADHLRARGFRRFAFCGIPHRIWSERRGEAFSGYLAAEGHPCQVYQPPRRPRDRDWGREQALLAQWLRELPKPVGLMACNDDRGRQVLEACQAAGIEVPEEVAVVGMDNDELLCELANPPLSSVALNTERGGYEAAALLDAMMRGRRKGPERILVEPLHVVVRQSSDVVALDDRHVAAALTFIRENAAYPIQVADVVRHAGLSRRALEVRFRREVKRSVHEEIQRVRLERAERLLVETDLAMGAVATAAGFGSASYLGLVFRGTKGITPARYRTRARAR